LNSYKGITQTVQPSSFALQEGIPGLSGSGTLPSNKGGCNCSSLLFHKEGVYPWMMGGHEWQPPCGAKWYCMWRDNKVIWNGNGVSRWAGGGGAADQERVGVWQGSKHTRAWLNGLGRSINNPESHIVGILVNSQTQIY
jgi:hypothetical protein